MDPNEEARPTCKVCLGTEGLIEGLVCDCAGSVAHICWDCLSGTITQVCLPQKCHVDEQSGDPLCPDCKAPYRNIQLDYVHDDESFLDYTVRVHGWSRVGTVAMFSIPTLILIGGIAGYFRLVSQFREDRFARRMITVIFIFVAGLLACFLFGGLVEFYDIFDSYRRRRPTHLRILPSGSPRPDSRRSRNQDVVIDMHVIPRIETPESYDSEVFRTITPATLGLEDSEMSHIDDSDLDDRNQ